MSSCNSWVIVDRETLEAVFETYNEELVNIVNTEKYIVMTAYEYLCDLNKRLKEGTSDVY